MFARQTCGALVAHRQRARWEADVERLLEEYRRTGDSTTSHRVSTASPRHGGQLPENCNASLIKWRQILRVVQRPFGWVFWLLEQRIGELDVEIERRRT